jgi:hypothetical protein
MMSESGNLVFTQLKAARMATVHFPDLLFRPRVVGCIGFCKARRLTRTLAVSDPACVVHIALNQVGLIALMDVMTTIVVETHSLGVVPPRASVNDWMECEWVLKVI